MSELDDIRKEAKLKWMEKCTGAAQAMADAADINNRSAGNSPLEVPQASPGPSPPSKRPFVRSSSYGSPPGFMFAEMQPWENDADGDILSENI